MKTIIFTLLLFLCGFAQAQNIEIIQPTTGKYVIKQESYTPDSLLKINYLSPVLDSLGMIVHLFESIERKERQKAQEMRAIREKTTEARDLITLSGAFTDSLYYDYSQKRLKDRYIARRDLPNVRIRIGSNWHWGKIYVAGNDLLRLELTDNQGNFLSTRDASVMRIESSQSFFVPGLNLFGERVDFFLESDVNNRRVFYGEKSDGTIIRIIQILER